MREELVFELERETKNCYRFQEKTRGKPPIVGTLYVQKWAFERTPKEVRVVIEEVEK